MFPLNYALAVALLTAPADRSEAPADLQAFATLRPTLQAVALSWELLDPRECRSVLTRPQDFAGDLKLVRRRYDELWDAPSVHDCMRFPDRALVNDLLAFNRAYRQHLCSRQSLERVYWWEVHQAVEETNRLYDIWDLVRDARCDVFYVSVRRQALKKLREAVGPEAYYNGPLPPHVPVWRFARID
jgi:hypothetical protein